MIHYRLRSLLAPALPIVLAQLALAGASAQPGPDHLHAAVSLSSDHVLNGLRQTDADPSLAVALDFEHDTGFFAGGSLANVDYSVEYGSEAPRATQTNLYVGYVWRRGDWMTNLAVSRYRYPGSGRDYDYGQAAVTASFRDRYFLTLGRSDEFLAVYDSAEHYVAGFALPWWRNLELSANAGRFRADGFFESAYSFWDVGISRPLGRFALDFRYHDNSYGRASLIGNRDANLWVLSMSYVFLPLDRSGL